MRLRTGIAVAVAALMLAGCGAATPSTGPTIVWHATGIQFYPACGNEVLTYDGMQFYPLFADEADALDTSVYPSTPPLIEDEALPDAGWGGGGGGLGRVVAPGPGDDTGTLLVYSDGFAHFTSDSGDLDVWLSNEVHEYTWVC